ncbi:MAG: DUF1217 domain-containing protein [Pseudomonadota bacterium]
MFLPILPTNGIGGWQYLQRTYEDQLTVFENSPSVGRDIDYFRENIGNVTSAQDLVQDRRLLEVALGAFGLQEDIDNRFFIQKILEEGTTAQDSLANRFSDTRYREFSQAFSFGVGETSRIRSPDFLTEVLDGYKANSFEAAVGEQDEDMRIALYARRVLADVVGPPQKSAEEVALEQLSILVDNFAGEIAGEADYFEARIGSVETADDLINDRRLLQFALSAYGLEDEFDAIESFVASGPNDMNEAEERIRAVLTEGSISVVARANEIGDQRYIDLSRGFGFGIAESLRTNDLGFASEVVDQYIGQNFSVPEDINYQGPLDIVNSQLVFERSDQSEMSNDAKWLTIMGEPPLRALFEKAFNLPSQFGQADIDQQLTVFKERSRRDFGSDDASLFADPDRIDDLIVKFLARSQIGSFSAAASPASVALTLLQG